MTREKIQDLGRDAYREETLRIINSTENLIKKYQPNLQVVISSGAVNSCSDEYGLMKAVEEHRLLTGPAIDKKDL